MRGRTDKIVLIVDAFRADMSYPKGYKRGWGTPALSFGFECRLFAVSGRVPRDLSAVGKTPKKSRHQKLQLYFPGTIPRRREALSCSAPPGVLPAYPLTFL